MNVPPWMVIARREFLERVRTGWFIVVTLLGPVFMVGLIVVPTHLAVESVKKGFEFDIVDRTGRRVGEEIRALVIAAPRLPTTVHLAQPTTDLDELLRRVDAGEIDGYLLLPEDLFGGGSAVYRGENASAIGIGDEIDRLVNRAVREIRARDLRLDKADLETLLAEVSVRTVQREGTSGQSSFFTGYAVMLILYMSILLYAVNVMRSVVLEKTNRVVEIVVSAVRPRALMFGKILGVGGVGVFQLALWAVIAMILFHYRAGVMGLFGIPRAASVAFALPPVVVGDVLVALTYFVLGFFFYASLYAAIGAMVNSDQEAQQAQTPIVLLLIIPAACVQVVAGDPRGTAAELFTLLPFSSAILMPMRWVMGGATAVDLALSLCILVVSTAAVVWLAGRIYRVGILMYGKRPSLRELARWVRYTD
jgi:ABC-2 type transport system permease protein